MDDREKRLKAQFAAMETALNNSQTQQAWLTGQIAVAADARDEPQARARPADQPSDPSLPPNQEPSLATYAGNPTAAYKQQSILTAPPGRLVVMLYDGCLRFLFQSAYAMREGDRRPVARTACAAPRRSSTSCTVTLDHERGGEIASRLQGIYAFCRRHLIEASHRAGPRQDRGGLRAPRPSCARPGPRSPRRLMPEAPWAELVALAERERELVREGRWDELAERVRRSALQRRRGARRAARRRARPHLERLRRAPGTRSTPGCPPARAFTRQKLGEHEPRARPRCAATRRSAARAASSVEAAPSDAPVAGQALSAAVGSRP